MILVLETEWYGTFDSAQLQDALEQCVTTHTPIFQCVRLVNIVHEGTNTVNGPDLQLSK